MESLYDLQSYESNPWLIVSRLSDYKLNSSGKNYKKVSTDLNILEEDKNTSFSSSPDSKLQFSEIYYGESFCFFGRKGYQVIDPLIRSSILLKTRCMSDVCFLVGDFDGDSKARFDVHKFYLSEASPVFYTMFQGSLPVPENSNVHIPDTCPEAFSLMIEYIYCGILPANLEVDLGISTLYLARKYLMPRLEFLIVAILESSVSIENVLPLYEVGRFYGIASLESTCYSYIEKNIREVIMRPEWTDLSSSALVNILKSDNLDVEEIDLYNAIFTDYSFDHNDSDCSIFELIPHIRFPLMSAAEFADGPARCFFLTPDEVSSIFVQICSSPHDKPPCKFSSLPRAFKKQEPEDLSKTIEEEGCHCAKNELICFFCATFGGGDGEERRRRFFGNASSSPAPYCRCRTNGLCVARPVPEERPESVPLAGSRSNVGLVTSRNLPRREFPIRVQRENRDHGNQNGGRQRLQAERRRWINQF